MCGLVSSAAKWIEFDAAWIAALQSQGLTERFHMTRFVNGSHEYGAWKGDDDKRATTAERLLKIIKRHVHKCLRGWQCWRVRLRMTTRPLIRTSTALLDSRRSRLATSSRGCM